MDNGDVSESNTNRRGILLALGAAILFGASTPLAKALLGTMRPQLVAGLLYVGSGTGLGTSWLLLCARRWQNERPLGRGDLPWFGAAIAAGGVVAPLLLMIGLQRTEASGASLLLNLEGVFTALLAWFAFHENFDRRIALGMFAIVLGATILSWQGQFRLGSAVGPLLIAAACLIWALDNNFTQKVSAGDPVQIAAVKGLVAGTANTATAFVLGATVPSLGQVVSALILGLMGYGVSLVLYVRALRWLGTARTGAYFSVAPFAGAVLSIVIWRLCGCSHGTRRLATRVGAPRS